MQIHWTLVWLVVGCWKELPPTCTNIDDSCNSSSSGKGVFVDVVLPSLIYGMRGMLAKTARRWWSRRRRLCRNLAITSSLFFCCRRGGWCYYQNNKLWRRKKVVANRFCGFKNKQRIPSVCYYSMGRSVWHVCGWGGTRFNAMLVWMMNYTIL